MFSWLQLFTPSRKTKGGVEMESVSQVNDRADLDIGLTTWAFSHIALLLRAKLTLLDVSVPASAESFLQIAGLDRDEIKALGQQARDRGCARNYGEYCQRLSDAHSYVWVRGKPDGDWKELDSTVVDPLENETQRQRVAPTWDGSTCAMDCALVMANFMNAGRLRGDAIPIPRLMGLPYAAFALRYTISLPLSTLSQEQLDGTRDVMLGVMNKVNHDIYPLPISTTRWWPFTDMFFELTTGLPQVTWYEIAGETCCDGVLKTRTKIPRGRNGTVVDFKTPQDTMEMMVNDRFSKETVVQSTPACTRLDRCDHRAVKKQHVVLWSLPPRLIVGIKHTESMKVLRRRGVFKDITIKYNTPTGTRETVYTVKGIVYLRNGNHFTCRWKFASGIIDHDAGRLKAVESWDARTSSQGVNTVIYQMKE